MPHFAPMKTSDGRFGYEAAGDPALPPLVFLHGIGGAARAWRGQLDFFGDRYRTIAWDMPGYGGSAPLPTVSIAALADALQDFLRQIGAIKPILVGHSIGGMIVQQLLAKNPDIAGAVVLAQTSPGVRQTRRRLAEGLHRRAARPARSRRNHGLAGAVAGEGIGRRRPRHRRYGAGARLHGRRSRGDLSRHDAGADGIRSAQRAEGYRGADAGAVGLKGQQCAGADDGEDGELYSIRQIC